MTDEERAVETGGAECANGGDGDAIAALVARVSSAEDVSGVDGGEATTRGAGAAGAAGEEDDESAWMADIDARMATIEDLDVKGDYGSEYDGAGASVGGEGPGQFDGLFEDRGDAIVDFDEASMKTTSIMSFLETFALGPKSLNGGRVTPTMGEVLERVKARKPTGVPEWTMTAAAATSAYQFAVNKKYLALQAQTYAKEAKKRHAKLQSKADGLASHLHVLQYGKTPDGKPVKPGQFKAPPHQTRPKGKLPPPPPAETSALWKKASDADVCHVCGEGFPDYWRTTDEIVFCDACDVQVHMSCYGLTKVPSGDWYCRGCKEGVTKGPLVSVGTPRGICTFCPHPGGALVRCVPPSRWAMPWLTPGHHAHLACALHLPEVKIGRDEDGYPIVDMSSTKAARMNLKCSVCNETGACTQCAMHKCFHAFHPLCARANEQVVLRQALSGQPMAFCKAHSDPEFEQQRFLTCGYAEDGSTDEPRNSSVFWADDPEKVAAAAAASRIATKLSKEKEKAKEKEKEREKEKEKEKEKIEIEVFSLATSTAAKRVTTITLLWERLLALVGPNATSRELLNSIQASCAEVNADEMKILNEMSADDAAKTLEEAFAHMKKHAPRMPQNGALHADSPPWKHLKQHQIEAVHWMRDRFTLGLGGMIAFETGLGKRLTALAFIQWVRDGLREPGQHLIVCSRETVHLWVADLHKWCTSLRSINLMTPEDEKTPANAPVLKNLSFDYILMPYDCLGSSTAIKSMTFKSVICDEWREGSNLETVSKVISERSAPVFSTFFLGGSKSSSEDSPLNGVTANELRHFTAILFKELSPAVSKSSSFSEPLIKTLTFRTTERVVEPPVIPAPLTKFFNIPVGDMHPADALMHTFRKLRKDAHKVLIVAKDENVLKSIMKYMQMAKLQYERIDEADKSLGHALYAVARYNTASQQNAVSFLFCRFDNLRRQQGLLSNTTSIMFADGEYSDKIDASGVPVADHLWIVANRVWGLEPVKETTNFITLNSDDKPITWNKATLNKISDQPSKSVAEALGKIPPSRSFEPNLGKDDDERWDAAIERKRKRAEVVEDPSWWTLHEHTCMYCNAAPGQCKNIPPAFLPPEKAGMKIRCISCPRITSMGCAYIRTVPQKGWECPQHSCLVCAKEAAPGHITFRCVSCFRAFCDSCSSGAAFDAIDEHPVWGPSGFTLPEFYEYVRCSMCVGELLAEKKRRRR